MAGGREELLGLIREAWVKVRGELAGDSDGLRDRLTRRAGALAGQPPRAWCLAVRANDLRVNKWAALIRPTDAADADVRCPHTVLLDYRLLKRLCAPVYIDGPGEPAAVVAAKLGTTRSNLLSSRLKGRFRTNYVPPAAGRGGKRIPLLNCDGPLDPCARGFAGADPLWNLTCEFLPYLLPRGFEQMVRREPHFEPPARRSDLIERGPSKRLPAPPPDYAWYKWKDGVYQESAHEKRLARRREVDRERRRRKPEPSKVKGSLRFKGWDFVCPGCGRRVKVVYLPLPVMELAVSAVDEIRSQISELKFEMPGPLETFACALCHRVRNYSPSRSEDWGKFVSYVSGGLLYGREVPRPEWIPVRATRRQRSQLTRAAPRREEVLRRFLAGEPVREMAWAMSVRPKAIYKQLGIVCRQERVEGLEALSRKLGGVARAAPLRGGAAERREKVMRLRLEGLSVKEIAARLGVLPHRVWYDLKCVYRRHGVRGRRGRAELAEKLGVPLVLSRHEENRERMRGMRERGKSVGEMANALGVGVETVRSYLRRMRLGVSAVGGK